MRHACLFSLICCLATDGSAFGAEGDAVKLGEATTQQWRIGMEITASGGACFGIVATLPIPIDWPEQQVEIVEERKSKHVKYLRYRKLDGVSQMLITIPQLRRDETAFAYVRLKVKRHAILSPKSTESLSVPERVSDKLDKYLDPSPYIESDDAQIRSVAEKILDGKDDVEGWQRVEAIYDWVRENVRYEFDQEIKGALTALRDEKGDCEELTSLFIALCRANKIPARAVWVPNHCYPEFYLEDPDGYGHWFPCQAAGARDFGSMPDQRPILQKGDNFKVPEKRQAQRYVAEFLKVKSVKGNGQPTVRFERQLIPPAE